MRRAVAFVLLSLVASPVFAFTDHPITGAKLVLKQSSSGRQKLVFQSKDPTALFPAIGGPDDPSTHGATIEIFSSGATGGPFIAPSNAVQQPGWTAKSGTVAMHKYKRDKAYAATTAIKSIAMKDQKVVSVLGDATGVPIDGARGFVAIRITVGDLRNCARFDGASVIKDVPGTFQAKNASAAGLSDCDIATLTGEPPTCGDGDLNQPSEECEGACETDFGTFGCRPPGVSNECSCCSDSWSDFDCCKPAAILLPTPAGGKQCIATQCSPPDACEPGDQCQPDHTCCSVNGGNPCVKAYPWYGGMVPLNECCPGLECRRMTVQGAVCCAAGGTACAGDGDCCTGHCQLDGTCDACRAGAVGCTSDAECCSGSCSAGACDACALAGKLCSSGATCCSGVCSYFQCQP